MAASILGITAALVMGVGGYFYLRWREKQLAAAGEVYTEPEDTKIMDASDSTPLFIRSVLSLLTVLITLNLLKWDIVTALIAGIILIMLLNIKTC